MATGPLSRFKPPLTPLAQNHILLFSIEGVRHRTHKSRCSYYTEVIADWTKLSQITSPKKIASNYIR